MSEFLQSASSLASCPSPRGPEIAFLGRSNAGKSTLINHLLGRRLAKVSSKPGHTRLLNFFWDSVRNLVLVDLPGYGFSKASKAESASWKGFIEPYLLERENLRALVLVMDIRRDWQAEEDSLLGWLHNYRQLPLILVLTKLDKLNQKEKSQRLKYFQGLAGVEHFFPVSHKTGDGFRELNQAFEKLVHPW